jgi:hypothetical protein
MSITDGSDWLCGSYRRGPHIDWSYGDRSGDGPVYRAHCPRCGVVGPVRSTEEYVTAARDRDRHRCEAQR